MQPTAQQQCTNFFAKYMQGATGGTHTQPPHMVLQPRVLVGRAAVVQAAPPHHVLPHVPQLLHTHRLQRGTEVKQ